MSDMSLPEGKICADCINYEKTCMWLFGCKRENIICDWSPSKFQSLPNTSTTEKEDKV